MTVGTYKLEVDWDGDGDFDDDGEDITADWMNASITRGFADPLARVATVGRANFTVKNAARTYSPVLNADVLPRRAVRFSLDTGGFAAPLFTGYLEDIKPSAGGRRDRRAVLNCVDAQALLDLHDGRIPLLEKVYAHEIIAAVVEAVFTPAATNYERGKTLYPFSSDRWTSTRALLGVSAGLPTRHGPTETGSAGDKLLDVCTSDWGRFFISKAGTPTFYNRHHTPLDTNIDLTLNNAQRNLSYSKGVGQVYNQVEVTCYPRAVGKVLEVIGRLSQGQAPRLEAGATQRFTLSFRDSATRDSVGGKDVQLPAAGTDYRGTADQAGEGDDRTADLSVTMTVMGDSAEVAVENTGTDPVYLQHLQVRGYAVRAREPVTVQASDGTSQTAYQKRNLTIDAPLLSSQHKALRLAQYLLDVYREPQPVVRGIEVLANRSSTFLQAARDMELLNRVVITEQQTGLASYGAIVIGVRHNIANAHNHVMVLDVETAYAVGTPFRLDLSALNSGHVLLY